MTVDDNGLVQCYNKGCMSKFDPNDNGPDSCTFHPGPPYFHDAYKIWNCCNKKSTDFSTWLSYKGCTKGPHNGEKPADIVRIASTKEIRPEKEEEVIVWNGLNKPAERLSDGKQHRSENFPLRVETTAGARAAIERFKENNGLSNTVEGLRIGAPCRNAGCDRVFAGPDSEKENCVHHPGAAVFHEGMKYWSCCQKKTSDFGVFLEQKGCEKGSHNWSRNEKVDKLREDWFSSNGWININAYCKGALPELLNASTNGIMLNLNLVHGFGEKETTLNYDLWGEIVPDDSFVRVGERKVELVLKQKEVAGWPRLRYEPTVDEKCEEDSGTA